MKNSFLVGIAALCIILFSCKHDAGGPSPDITGFWLGSYDDTHDFGMLFRNNGTVRVYDITVDTLSASIAEGTYVVGSDSVRASYDYGGVVFYSCAAKLSNNDSIMTGTYGQGDATSGEGVFILVRQ